MTSDPSAPQSFARKPCPICGKLSTAETHPFCSRRCADVDLNRWLGGVYAVPSTPIDEDDSSTEAAEAVFRARQPPD